MTYIYALVDPRDDEIGYIGKSNNPLRRYAWLMNSAKRHCTRKVDAWIRSLLFADVVPELEILECGVLIDEWEEAEREWIRNCRADGYDLANVSDGGYSSLGRKCSIETRRKMSKSQKGRIFSTEHRKKLSVAGIGRKVLMETRKRMSESHKGKKHSAESKRKMSEAQKKAWKKRREKK